MKAMYLVAVLAVALPHQAGAWGQEGHSIIAEIAQRRLSPTAHDKVREILGGEISLASIANWADDAREIYAKTSNWHFVDIPLEAISYDPERDCQETPRGDCIINAIERNKQALSDPASSAKERQEALKFIVHFIGDVHQPLHTVKDYVGGNEYPVTFFTDPSKRKKEETNLHIVWDSGLIRATVWNWGAYVDRIEEQWLPGKNSEMLSSGTPIDWALEAHQIAIAVALSVPMNADLGDDYLTLARPHVDRQLALAGLRLARTLNELLK